MALAKRLASLRTNVPPQIRERIISDNADGSRNVIGPLPDAIEHFNDIAGRFAARRPAMFLDYDGTLVPIATRPELASTPERVKAIVQRLADKVPVAVVSGRGRADVASMLGVEGIAYAGSHGFDIRDAAGNDLSGGIGAPFRPALESAAEALTHALSHLRGTFVEDKLFSLAVHYREADEAHHAEIAQRVDHETARHENLRRTGGKMIHELRPAIDWHKGKAVLRVMAALGLDAATCMPIYIGDDETDEDAFLALRETGLGIRVGHDDRETAADYALGSPDDVATFLEMMADVL